MQWKSGTYKNITSDFLLDETLLRKVTEVISSYAEKLPYETRIKFKVFKADGGFYHTKSVDEVLQDDNSSKKKINRLVIELLRIETQEKESEDKNDEVMFIDFDKEYNDKIHYEIDEKDRDWCFLFADELEMQISRTKNDGFLRKAKSYWFQGGVYFSSSIIFAFAMFWFIPSEAVQVVLSQNPGEAIPFYVISQTKIIIAALFGFFVMEALNYSEPLDVLSEKLQHSVFYWGDEKLNHDKISELKKRIFWSVIVAFIVSVSAGVTVLLAGN